LRFTDSRFVIYGRKADGSVHRLFGWCRDEASGLATARRCAAEACMTFAEYFAKPVDGMSLDDYLAQSVAD